MSRKVAEIILETFLNLHCKGIQVDRGRRGQQGSLTEYDQPQRRLRRIVIRRKMQKVFCKTSTDFTFDRVEVDSRTWCCRRKVGGAARGVIIAVKRGQRGREIMVNGALGRYVGSLKRNVCYGSFYSVLSTTLKNCRSNRNIGCLRRDKMYHSVPSTRGRGDHDTLGRSQFARGRRGRHGGSGG